MRWLNQIFSKKADVPEQSDGGRKVKRLSLPNAPPVTYAVGDIHGCLDLFKSLEAQIVEDAQAFDGPKLLVVLGDFIDRGYKSASVIDHLLLPAPKGFTRVALMGNHEERFQAFCEAPSGRDEWLGWGGAETLNSYGIQPHPEKNWNMSSSEYEQLIASTIPQSHRDFIDGLPASLMLPQWFFCHAGVDENRSLQSQFTTDLFWGRAKSNAKPVEARVIVHGHVPVEKACEFPGRINVDTGAYASGVLSAVRLVEGQDVAFLAARN